MNSYIKQGDCLELMKEIPDNSIDLIITDPPYGISRTTNFMSGKPTGNDTDRFRVSMDFGDWDYDFNQLQDVIIEAYRVLKNSGTMICFYDLWKLTILKNFYENAGFKQIRFVEWIKTNPVPLNSKINYLTNSREVAVCGVKKSNPTFNSSYDNGIYKYPICHNKERIHPTQKPVELIQDLIIKHSNENEAVLDPFLGSGTTCVAAINTNRKYIGFEIDGAFFNVAEQRIKEAESKRSLS